MGGFTETWEKLPWITRHVGALATLLFAVYCINPYWAVLGWNYLGAPRWQLWRYFVAPLSFSGNKMSGFLELANVCMSLQNMELNFWRKRSSAAYYLIFVCSLFDVVGPYLGVYTYLSSLNMALIWTLAQEAPYAQYTLIIVSFDQRFAPLAQLGFRFLMGGAVALTDPFLGFIAAHLFLYLTELLPRVGGPTWFINPPKLLYRLDNMVVEKEHRDRFGEARRMGREK